MLKKPTDFNEMLECQAVLDRRIADERDNGFVPRKRCELDILMALDDEIQEWAKELPQELNFKTWKQKEYNRAAELEEYVDIMFFYLQLINMKNEQGRFYSTLGIEFNAFSCEPDGVLRSYLHILKNSLWGADYKKFLQAYIKIAKLRGFTKDEIVNKYWEKLVYNLGRLNKKGDWVL